MKNNLNSREKYLFTPLIGKIILPKNLASIMRKVPDFINYRILEILLNRAFIEQIHADDFDFLRDRVLQVELTDANLFVGFTFKSAQLVCTHFDCYPIQADSNLSVDVNSAIDLINQKVDPDTLFFRRKLRISGDTELAHHIKNVIDTLDPALIPKIASRLLSRYQLTLAAH